MMTDNAILTRKADIVTASMDGETVMMSVETGKYYNLGSVGGAIWALLDTQKTFGQLVDALVVAYDVEQAQCAQDTAAFLTQLEAQGLLTIQGQPA